MGIRPTLTSDRLILRPFNPGDAEEIKRLAGNKKIAGTTLEIPHPYPLAAAKRWINSHQKKFDKGTEIIFAVEHKNKLVGSCGVVINKRFNSGEIGYWIGEEYWGNGFATESVGKLIEFSFETLNLNRIHAHHMSTNPASGRVMLNNGMKKEGILREHIQKDNQYCDAVVYGILRGEYMAEKKSSAVRHERHPQ